MSSSAPQPPPVPPGVLEPGAKPPRAPIHRKVQGAGIGGALGIAIVSILSAAGVHLDQAGAAAVSTVCAFVLSYLIPDSS